MITPAEYERLVRDEYAWLRQKLDLPAVDLEFQYTPASGFPKYGGTPRKIILPFSEHDLSVIYDKSVTPPAGPPTWEEGNRVGWSYWKRWRSDLWHEVIHQVQDQKNFGWDTGDGRNGHANGWQPAIEWAAKQLECVRPKELYDILASLDTPPFQSS
jgi:hypothetical protein